MTKTWMYGDIRYDTVVAYGDKNDRVIETVGKKGAGLFEVGYYNGDGKKKAIIDISTALGCDVGCDFCALTDTGPQLTAQDMLGQVDAIVDMVREIDGVDLRGKPLKINFAKTGEPSYNRQIPEAMRLIAAKYPGVSFKYSTVMPNIKRLVERIREVATFASEYTAGSVQLTISLISTNEDYRLKSANEGRLASFATIRSAIDAWHETNTNPEPRIPNLSLLVGPLQSTRDAGYISSRFGFI